MGKRGPKPKGKVKIKWSSNFAYAIGLLVTDGNISSDGRHITFVSKDKQQIYNFQNALNTKLTVSHTRSGYSGRVCPRIQFSDVMFWNFLHEIGITPNKSKIIGDIAVPGRYFFDFLRGCFDGDGTFYSYYDKRWKSSFMFYTAFVSASMTHIDWLRTWLKTKLNVVGHVTGSGRSGTAYQLKYAKMESLKILKSMYYSDSVICLSRKRKKIEKALKIAEFDRSMPRCCNW